MRPLFPFGVGLSYTRFSYEDLKVSSPVAGETETLHLEVIVRNIGSCAGREVVQVYVEAPAGRLARPPRELKSFGKTIVLQPGQSRVLRLDLPVSRLACYDPGLADWVVEPGRYRLLVGASSRDIRLETTVLIEAPVRLPPLEEDCTLTELITHRESFSRVCALFARKTGQSAEAVRELLEDNAPDIFTSTYRALTAMFGLELGRDELSRAIHGD
jgi:beta-glucosidase